jgi:hypothetical protein
VIDVARRKGKTLGDLRRLAWDRTAFRQWTEDPTLLGNRDRWRSIYHFYARLRWIVSLTPRPLRPRRKSTFSWAGRAESVITAGNRIQGFRLVTIATELSHFMSDPHKRQIHCVGRTWNFCNVKLVVGYIHWTLDCRGLITLCASQRSESVPIRQRTWPSPVDICTFEP